jgi:hypothetical protein
MKELIKKYLNFNTTLQEEKQLNDWIYKDAKNLNFFKKEIYEYGIQNHSEEIFDIEKSLAATKRKLNISKPKPKRIIYLKKYYKYAAIFILVICSQIYFLIKKDNLPNIQNESFKAESLAKDPQKIILTLNDGTKKIIADKKEMISYLDKKTTTTKIEYNEITVPRGQVFQILLSDSTKVWLNAETKIKYPKYFIKNSKTRTVFLDGEAFFDVSHNKNQPFIVATNGINVEVLGTKFNVSSYPTQKNIHTTLVEGSVKVIDTTAINNSLLIKPSQQASFNRKEKSLVSKKVNTNDYTAWMDKRIVFQDITLEEVLEKIARVYNVEIVNNNEAMKKEKFTGEFDVEDINTIFKALSTSIKFNYQIKKNRILIKTEKNIR